MPTQQSIDSKWVPPQCLQDLESKTSAAADAAVRFNNQVQHMTWTQKQNLKLCSELSYAQHSVFCDAC
eukprot:862325-Amphidinium_carterae.1